MNVSNTALNTTISNSNGVKVSTIEHLMGALFGLGIDNALVEIDNEEVPILDGSAKEFIKILTSCGLKKSEAPIKIIKIQKKIIYNHGEKLVRKSLKKIPDGLYQGFGQMDSNGVEEGVVKFKISIEVKDSNLILDLTETPDQQNGPINSPLPSTVSKVFSFVLLSSTVITPSFPTLSIAAAIKFPTSLSLLAEIVATCLI